MEYAWRTSNLSRPSSAWSSNTTLVADWNDLSLSRMTLEWHKTGTTPSGSSHDDPIALMVLRRWGGLNKNVPVASVAIRKCGLVGENVSLRGGL